MTYPYGYIDFSTGPDWDAVAEDRYVYDDGSRYPDGTYRRDGLGAEREKQERTPEEPARRLSPWLTTAAALGVGLLIAWAWKGRRKT